MPGPEPDVRPQRQARKGPYPQGIWDVVEERGKHAGDHVAMLKRQRDLGKAWGSSRGAGARA